MGFLGVWVMDKRYEGWSTSRKYATAIDRVESGQWSQSEAARRLGISRTNLNKKLKEKREADASRYRRDAERAEAEEVPAEEPALEELDAPVIIAEPTSREPVDPQVGPYNPHALDTQSRRFPETLQEFVDTYLTEWKCPDCAVTHRVPDFHEEMWRALDDHTIPRLLINVPPFHSKSTVVTVWDTVRKLARNPNLRIGIISAQAEFASTFLKSIRRMLEDPELYHNSRRNLIDDWGPFIPEGRGGWASNSITVAKREGAEKDPSVIAQGFGSHIYGRRFDEIKYDDVATLANQRNPETVAKMLHSIETEHLNRVGKTGRVIWVGTRVNPGDIYSVFGQRPAYKVIRYPAILNEQSQEVLWPEHVPFSYLETLRGEMDPVTFQLVYQNVEMPGMHASFTQEMLDNCKDTTRSLGHYESTWKLVAGLDPAGGGEWAGYTSFTLLAIDLATSRRYLVDQVAVKSMKAPQILQQMRDWTEHYPISKWVVEANGLQGQLFQYNVELVQWLAARGVQLVPHVTGAHNKWDQQFGVETIAPLMHQGLVSIPWGTAPTAAKVQPTIEEFVQFPMGQTTDRVMSWWFAELGVREYMRAMATPMFDERRRVPARVRKRRHVVSFGKGRIDPMPDPRRGVVYSGMTQDRFEVGRPLPPGEVSPWQPDEEEAKAANVDLDAIWGGRR